MRAVNDNSLYDSAFWTNLFLPVIWLYFMNQVRLSFTVAHYDIHASNLRVEPKTDNLVVVAELLGKLQVTRQGDDWFTLLYVQPQLTQLNVSYGS